MIFALCAALVIVFLAALYSQDRAHKRATEAHEAVIASYRVEIAHLAERVSQERKEHRAEIQMLCQRIQAPEVAVMQHQIETAGPPEQTYPLNDTEAAKRQEQEVLARIAEMENREAVNGY